MHTSVEDLTTPTHPRGWAHENITGDLDLYTESSKSSSLKSVYLNLYLTKGLSGRL